MKPRRPWRDRPDSFSRDYVLGCAIGGWFFAVIMIPLVVIAPTLLWLFAVMVLMATLATFMWRHG